MRTKGQVSIFIIIGILLLLGLSVYMFLQIGNQEQRIDEVAVFTEQTVATEFTSVDTYVDACLYNIGKEGIQILGAQGGYIYPELLFMQTNTREPTAGDAFQPFGESSSIVPYWYYLSSNNNCEANCEFDTMAPLLEGDSEVAIEYQLKLYLQNNFYTCIDNFRALEDQAGFEIDQLDAAEFNVLFTENDVQLQTRYPLYVRGSDGSDFTFETFTVTYDVPLKRMHEYASLVAVFQSQLRLFERSFLDVISLHEGLDTESLPPRSSLTFNEVSTLFWIKENVRGMLQDLLLQYTQMHQVANAANFDGERISRAEGSPFMQQLLRKFDFPIGPDGTVTVVEDEYASRDESFNRIEIQDNIDDPRFGMFAVTFDYLEWPIYFNTNHDGAIIDPHSIDVPFISFGLQEHQTYYDISYPVLATIYDPMAFGEEGFALRFGLEANIRDNEILTESYVRESTPYLEAEDLSTFVCDFEQRNSGNVSIELTDSISDALVDDAVVVFVCGDDVCPVGTTESGFYDEKLPVCFGAKLLAKKEGYVDTLVDINTNLNQNVDLELQIEPIQEKNVSVRLLRKEKIMQTVQGPRGRIDITYDWTWGFSPVDMRPSEEGFVVIERISDDPNQEKFVRTFEVNGSSFETPTVEIVTGRYKVFGLITETERVLIPEDVRETGGWDSETYIIPEIELNDSITGDLKLDESTWYFEVTTEDLANSDEIQFILPGVDLKTAPNKVVEDLEEWNTIQTFTLANKQLLEPRFISYD